MVVFVQSALLALTALSLGLRTTSVIAHRLHPVARILVAAIVGSLFVVAGMQLAMRNHLHDLGLGLLLSLSPVGVFDGMKWWYRWQRGSADRRGPGR
jgi:hypothetical protein